MYIRLFSIVNIKSESIMNTTFFQRILLPGFLLQSVLIGGGYATGRELVEFFLSSGPLGGFFGLIVATAIFSLIRYNNAKCIGLQGAEADDIVYCLVKRINKYESILR